MSFRCEGCGKPSPKGTPQTKVVTKTRQKTYTKVVEGKYGPKTIVLGQGRETVEEKNLCVSCVEALDNLD